MTLTTEAAGEEPAVEQDCFLELRDRTPVIVHRARRRDRAGVEAFVDRLSTDSIELRFSAPVRAEAVAQEVLGDTGPGDRLSLLMETLEEVPRVVGSCECVRYPRETGRAEVAFLIADEFQGRGAGTLLLRDLARRARSVGIRWFTAVVMAENFAMRDVFLQAGFPYRVVWDRPVLLIELDIGTAVEPGSDGDPTRVARFVPAE
jgi:RimJ/RimL family protein N-acetyltransferase